VVKVDNERIAVGYNEDGFTSVDYSFLPTSMDFSLLLKRMAGVERYITAMVVRRES
jgi:hypothetical protein